MAKHSAALAKFIRHLEALSDSKRRGAIIELLFREWERKPPAKQPAKRKRGT